MSGQLPALVGELAKWLATPPSSELPEVLKQLIASNHEVSELMLQLRANPEKVESMLDPTRSGLIQAVCWAGGQQTWVSPMLTTYGWLRSG